jgi:hypothetical protein
MGWEKTMTLVLQLDPELETRLKTEAAEEGLELAEYVEGFLRTAPRRRRLKGYGMLKHLGGTLDQFHEERQREKARELENERERGTPPWTTS